MEQIVYAPKLIQEICVGDPLEDRRGEEQFTGETVGGSREAAMFPGYPVEASGEAAHLTEHSWLASGVDTRFTGYSPENNEQDVMCTYTGEL